MIPFSLFGVIRILLPCCCSLNPHNTKGEGITIVKIIRRRSDLLILRTSLPLPVKIYLSQVWQTGYPAAATVICRCASALMNRGNGKDVLVYRASLELVLRGSRDQHSLAEACSGVDYRV